MKSELDVNLITERKLIGSQSFTQYEDADELHLARLEIIALQQQQMTERHELIVSVLKQMESNHLHSPTAEANAVLALTNFDSPFLANIDES